MTASPRTVLRLAWAMFYAGLIGVGMAGTGLTGLGVILLIMLLYTVVMRPVSHWAGLRLFPVTVAVLAVASGVLWLVGLGLGLLMWQPQPWTGVMTSLAGLALARVVWSPQKEAEMARQLDEAIARVEEGGTPPAPPPDPAALRLEAFLAEVRIAARRPGGDPADYSADIDAMVRDGLVAQTLAGLAAIDGDLSSGLQVEVMAHPGTSAALLDGAQVFQVLAVVLDMDDPVSERALTVAEGWVATHSDSAPEGAVATLADALAALTPSHPLRPRAEALLARLRGPDTSDGDGDGTGVGA